jgi:hypothetical protein
MKVKTLISKIGFKVKKYSPEILTGVGIAAIIGGTVLACKESMNVENILDEHFENLDSVKSDEDIPEENKRKYVTKVYFSTAKNFVKNYYPAFTLEVLGISSILAGHNILKKRNVALMAAYKTIETAFNEYRERVKEELGEEVDRHFRYGTYTEKINVTSTDENGKEKKTKENVEFLNPEGISEYARFFDESCREWTKSADYNLTWLKNQESHCTDLLRARGHLFLNEVYDLLGIPRTTAGAVVGWIDGNGDNFVDFGVFDKYKVKNRDFVNGYEPVILLDFNVDGVIYDKI